MAGPVRRGCTHGEAMSMKVLMQLLLAPVVMGQSPSAAALWSGATDENLETLQFRSHAAASAAPVATAALHPADPSARRTGGDGGGGSGGGGGGGVLDSASRSLKSAAVMGRGGSKGGSAFAQAMKGGGKSIVVVGNGESAVGTGLGKKIDEFEEVARFNYFQTEGYSEDVGTKTTVWVIAQIKHPGGAPADGRIDTVKRILVPFVYRPDSCASYTKKNLVDKKIDKLKTEFYSKPSVKRKTVATTLDEVSVLYTRYKLVEKYPSSGLQMLTFFAQYYDKVYYVGFDFYSGGHDHYYERKMKNYTCHNMRDEARVIQALEHEGHLINLNPAARPPPEAQIPLSQLYKSIKKDYDPDCKIVCGAENYLPEGVCQKWHAPNGVVPWQVKNLAPKDKAKLKGLGKPYLVDGPVIPNQGVGGSSRPRRVPKPFPPPKTSKERPRLDGAASKSKWNSIDR